MINRERRKIRCRIQKADRASTEQKQLLEVKKAVVHAIKKPAAIYSSWGLEKILLEIAQRHEVELAPECMPGSFLHVFTKCLSTGGHTRVAERWIENAGRNEVHSLVFTEMRVESVTERLLAAVQKTEGEVFSLSAENDEVSKALALRKLASKFEKIILHVHRYDLTPVLAFGTPSFGRVVVFFNHAEHLFWIGVSVTDVVADLSSKSIEFSKQKRGVHCSALLPIPIDRCASIQTKTPNRSEKDEGRFQIVSVAAAWKYTSFDEFNFIQTAEWILQEFNDVEFVVIGPSARFGNVWWRAEKRTKGRIKAVGSVPHSKVEEYLGKADVFLESFPFPSYTALLDAARAGLPVLSLKGGYHHIDSVYESHAICASKWELRERIESIQTGEADATQVFSANLEKYHFPEGWKVYRERLLACCPAEHAIHPFQNCFDESAPLDDEDVFLFRLIVCSNILGRLRDGIYKRAERTAKAWRSIWMRA